MSPRVLVAPMDWGLGHAARCVPLVRTLLEMNCKVMLAGSGSSLDMLKGEFPSLRCIELPPYDPQYPHSSALVWKLAGQLPRFFRTVRLEHRLTQSIVREYGIGIIISDNRYGCRSVAARSIFMGHQINLRLPASARPIEPVVNRYHRMFLRKFDCRWVPDWYGNDSLAGALSQSDRLDAEYLGPISRFGRLAGQPKVYDITFLLSGPEPQRSLLEERAAALAASSRNRRICIVRGVTSGPEKPDAGAARVFDRVDSCALAEILATSDLVVARSGYSTIMDMVHAGGKAVFVPTPGQTEQEYLARRLAAKGIAGYVRQEALTLDVIEEKSTRYAGFPGIADGHDRLRSAVRRILL